jgi:predicted unusual protein kinase regulating ubiquinone biosynthesis (AarF/ABC1/UbiB family)
MFWSDVRRGLSDAERIGVFHGDLHGGNVLVRPFHATIIDFGTSALSGKKRSRKRHARMVNEFAQKLLPELSNYIAPIDMRKLAKPKYATWVVGQWVEAACELRRLDAELSSISEKELLGRLTSLAKNYSTNLIDLHGPIAIWLANNGVSRKLLNAYKSDSQAELARRKRTFDPHKKLSGLP